MELFSFRHSDEGRIQDSWKENFTIVVIFRIFSSEFLEKYKSTKNKFDKCVCVLKFEYFTINF